MASLIPERRALVLRVGALGDVLLTRRLTCSLSLAGFRSTLFAPARHARLLKGDAWIEDVLDSESPALAGAFTETDLPKGSAGASGFDLGVVISRSDALAAFAERQCADVVRISPDPSATGSHISMQWTGSVGRGVTLFSGALPPLAASPERARVRGATLIHPGSGSTGKNWPLERFVGLSRTLAAEGHEVHWIEGPAESGLAFADTAYPRLRDLSLEELASTLAASRLYIGNDSGVSHLAGAVGARTLALFGPTDPSVWAPDGARVRTLQAPNRTMSDLSVEEILAAVSNFAATQTASGVEE